jgi:endonuclease/exonuclease/phosphatase family metal-dependent hydrolase
MVWRHLAAALLAATAMVPVAAQAQTLTLTDSSATTLRGGSYANANYSTSGTLATRASSDATYERRALLKFDTQNTIPAGSSIASATLTLTVRGGNPETRQVSAYRGTASYTESAATWNRRKSDAYWSEPGGDAAERAASAAVSNAAGSRVSFDVTALVQAVVKGQYGSRYTRVVLIDTGASSRDSYKEYYSDDASDGSVRPKLVVTLGAGTSTSTSTSSSTTTSGTLLKVLDWNTHHGVGTDGVYNIDRIATWIVKTGANVVSLNEVEKNDGWGNEDQPARYAALLKAKTGKAWYYKFAQRDGYTNGQGNLLLTTFPLDGTGSHLLSYDRSVGRIGIYVNGIRVNVFSTHLDADSSSYRTTEMKELKVWAGTYAEQRIIAGDFNAWPGATEIGNMTAAYYDAWAVAVSKGIDVSYSGNTAGNTRNSRIDYVFYSRAASRLVLKQCRVFDVRDANGVQPSDHRPVMATFEVK